MDKLLSDRNEILYRYDVTEEIHTKLLMRRGRNNKGHAIDYFFLFRIHAFHWIYIKTQAILVYIQFQS
jgi:hypothetical protein